VRRTSVGLIGGLMIAIIISGCTAKSATQANSTSTTQSVVATSEPTTGTVTDVADRISITLPPGYTRLLDPAQLHSIFGQSSVYQHAKIVAVKMPVTGPFQSNLAVVVAPAGGSLPPDVDQMFLQARDTLTGEGATIKSHSSAPVGGYPELRIDFTLPANARTIEGTEVYAIDEEQVHVTTMLQDEASYSATDVNDVINSISFK